MIFRFLHPWFLAALALLPLLAYLHAAIEARGRARIVFSDISAFKSVPPSARTRLRHSVFGLRALALALLIVALARPQHGNQIKEVMSKGIDIMMVLDVSGSMREGDMDPNRLAAAKDVINNFIDGREEGLQNDRIGLVVFSRIAFTKCPLTVDYTILKKIVSRAEFSRKEFDGTAIGSAIATAVSRMEKSEAKSKVMVLVTDGQNTTGFDPMTAAGIAKAMDIKIYTIGVVPDTFMTKVQDTLFGERIIPTRPQVDETQMKAIAEATGGKYFRAEDEEGLAKIFGEIGRMEKNKVKVKEFYRYSELYWWFAGLAIILFLAEAVLARTYFRRLP